MKFKKVIFTSIAAVSLSAVVSPAISSPQNTVNAAIKTKSLTKNAFVYNAKGKKVKSAKLAKGKKVKILGTKIIKGKKYYRIGKNKYVRVANFKAISKPTNPKVDTVPVPNTNNSISPTPTVPQQQPATPPVNNNGGSSNTDKPVTPPTNNNSNGNTDNSANKPANPTKPTNTPASQAEKDALIAYLKQINSITDVSSPDYEKYEMSSHEDNIKFSNAVSHAHALAENKYSTTVDLNNAKVAVEEAYNKLDGQRYQLPCSLMDFDNGRYILTEADKTAILNLANKVKGTKDAHFTSSDNQYVKYTIDDLYPSGLPTDNFLKFAKQ